MKILFSSHFFPPSIGGLEEAGFMLASEFSKSRHEVKVITKTRERYLGDKSFDIHANSSPGELLALTKWCDVVFHNNISLQTAWPLLMVGRPWVVVHQTWLTRPDGGRGWQDWLKQWSIRHAHNIVVSQALGRKLKVPARVIPNPYRSDLFQMTRPWEGRPGELVFLGRLVSDKGVGLLINALGILKGGGVRCKLTIIGDGPERTNLERQVRGEGLEDQVAFRGAMKGIALTELLNEHRLLVVPSLWEEPFGIVALDGMACGCVPIVSDGGGLPEAVGEAGWLFRRGDAGALAEAIRQASHDETQLEKLRQAAPAQLARHTPLAVAQQYLQVLSAAAPKKS